MVVASEKEVQSAIVVQSAERGRRERRKFRMAFVTVARTVAPPAWKKNEPLLRTLVIRLVEVNRLSDIDIIAQRFRAEVVIQLAFEGGAGDEHLSKTSDAFPLDGFGRPTFRPSASWYMNQVDFNNALEYKTLDKNVFVSGEDERRARARSIIHVRRRRPRPDSLSRARAHACSPLCACGTSPSQRARVPPCARVPPLLLPCVCWDVLPDCDEPALRRHLL